MNRTVATRFLHGPSTKFEIQTEVSDLISTSKSVRIAVAYWGKGAIKRLGLDRRVNTDVKIVCDLRSGGCNPNEVEELLSLLGKERALTLENLHAKIWLGDTGVIIGSSNASTNGFGSEGDEAAGLIEGNLFTSDPAIMAEVATWFDDIVLKKAQQIQEEDFIQGKKKWRDRRAKRDLPNGQKFPTLLAALKKNPAFFADRNILVWVYTQGYHSKEDRQAIEAEKEARHNSKIDAWGDVDEPLDSDTIVLEFDFGSRSKRGRFDGIWQVLHNHPFVDLGDGHNLLFCEKLKTVLGLPLGDRSAWEEAATRAGNSGSGKESWTLEEFGREFL